MNSDGDKQASNQVARKEKHAKNSRCAPTWEDESIVSQASAPFLFLPSAFVRLASYDGALFEVACIPSGIKRFLKKDHSMVDTLDALNTLDTLDAIEALDALICASTCSSADEKRATPTFANMYTPRVRSRKTDARIREG